MAYIGTVPSFSYDLGIEVAAYDVRYTPSYSIKLNGVTVGGYNGVFGNCGSSHDILYDVQVYRFSYYPDPYVGSWNSLQQNSLSSLVLGGSNTVTITRTSTLAPKLDSTEYCGWGMFVLVAGRKIYCNGGSSSWTELGSNSWPDIGNSSSSLSLSFSPPRC